ncbi:MAG: DUF3488 and transglutaminase-like domain-containing protein [Planctomycetota bacterium]|jgi:transglutaminase-like putative cysteine protease
MENAENRRKLISNVFVIALLLVAQASLAIASDRWILFAPLMAAAVVQPFLFPAVTIELSRMAQLVLTLPVAILLQVWPLDDVGSAFETTFYVSLYLILISVIQLYSKVITKKVSRVVLSGSLSLLFAGTAIGNVMTYLIIIISFSVLLFASLRYSLNIRQNNKKYNLLHFAMLAAALIITVAMSIGLTKTVQIYYAEISEYFYQISGFVRLKSAPGFSGEARLGSITDTRDGDLAKTVAVRIFADKEPGYLKGMVFKDYSDAKWYKADLSDRVKPDRGEDNKKLMGRVILPGMTGPGFEDKPEFNVFPADRYGANYFLPLKTSAFDTHNKSILNLPGNIYISEDKKTSLGYKVFVSEQPLRYGGGDSIYSEPCSDLLVRSALKLTVAKLNIRNENIEEKIAAVKRYFNSKYTYKVGIDFIPKIDPVIQFLTAKSHGHCELFATAGTLMLREMGIKARYVTGFVCSEKVSYGNLWLARNLNAHAWTEYYHPEKGWQTAEFTPASGVPDNMINNDSYYEYLYSLWLRLKGFGIRGILDLVFSYVGQFGQWLIGAWWRIAGLVIFMAWYFVWRNYKKNSVHKFLYNERDFKDEVKSAREKFFHLQEELKKQGLAKEECETLEEYSARILESNYENKDDVAEFIRYFAKIRYST